MAKRYIFCSTVGDLEWIRGRDLSVLYPVETESEAQPAGYPMHEGRFLFGKATTHEVDISLPFRSEV